MSRPNESPGAARDAFTKVPEPARRSTSPATCRSRIARPTVMRDAPNFCPSSASLGQPRAISQAP